MAASREYLQYVLEQLCGIAGVSARRLFSGFGLYCGSQVFGLVFGDTLYFKVGDASRPDYEARGMSRFRPFRDKPQLSTSYYEVPGDVLEDRDDLAVWGRRAMEAALAHAARKEGSVAKGKATKGKTTKGKATKGKPTKGQAAKGQAAKGAKRAKVAKVAKRAKGAKGRSPKL
jgi:DNA transformation protein